MFTKVGHITVPMQRLCTKFKHSFGILQSHGWSTFSIGVQTLKPNHKLCCLGNLAIVLTCISPEKGAVPLVSLCVRFTFICRIMIRCVRTEWPGRCSEGWPYRSWLCSDPWKERRRRQLIQRLQVWRTCITSKQKSCAGRLYTAIRPNPDPGILLLCTGITGQYHSTLGPTKRSYISASQSPIPWRRNDIFIFIFALNITLFWWKVLSALSPNASFCHDTAPFGSFDESLGFIHNSVFWFVSLNHQRQWIMTVNNLCGFDLVLNKMQAGTNRSQTNCTLNVKIR